MIFEFLKEKRFEKRIKKLGIIVKNKEDIKCMRALNMFIKKSKITRSNVEEILIRNVKTINLQSFCEKISGRKEAGSYLQMKPLVIQCHTCQKDFSNKKGTEFAGEKTIYKNFDDIVIHLMTCKGILCDCGFKRPYFENCKKCKIKWDKSCASLIGYRKDYPFSKKQREQLENYKKLLKSKGVKK